MKKKLQEMLSKKEARKKELGAQANKASDISELRGINSELETLNVEIAELRGVIDAMPGDAEKKDTEDIVAKNISSKLDAINTELSELRGKMEEKTKDEKKPGKVSGHGVSVGSGVTGFICAEEGRISIPLLLFFTTNGRK